MALIRQSRPASGFDFQAKVLNTFSDGPSSFGSGNTVNCDQLFVAGKTYNVQGYLAHEKKIPF